MPAPTHIARRSSRRRVRLRVTTSRGSSFTINVSAVGLCAELMRVLPMGTLVEGLIHLDSRDVSYVGRVSWRAGDSRLNQLGRMGVCFPPVDSQCEHRLAAPEVPSMPAGM